MLAKKTIILFTFTDVIFQLQLNFITTNEQRDYDTKVIITVVVKSTPTSSRNKPSSARVPSEKVVKIRLSKQEG
jgi:hypothetical protein